MAGLAPYFLLGAFWSCVGLSLHRPDLDDYFYIPNVQYFLDNPLQLMDYAIHFLSNCAPPITSQTWGTSAPFEYTRAIPAHFIALPYTSIYYSWTLACAGFAIAGSYALFMRFFIDDKKNLFWCVFFICLVLSFMTETHRTPGNFALPRMYQGKAWLLTLAVPCYGHAVLTFLTFPRWRNWLYLFLMTICFTGMSSSSVFLLPVLLVLVSSSYCISFKTRLSSKTVGGLLLSLTYLVAYAIIVIMFSNFDVGVASPVNEGYPLTFGGHLGFLWKGRESYIILISVACLTFCALFMKIKQVKFFCLWYLFVIVAILNPLVAPFYISAVTSPNAYWRFFYILPTLPCLALALLHGCNYVCGRWKLNTRTQAWILPGVCLFVLLLAVAPGSASYLGQMKSEFFLLDKLPLDSMKHAQEIAATAPKGPMLAPLDLAGALLIRTSSFPQASIRESGMKLWYFKANKELGAALFNAARCLDGHDCRESDLRQAFELQCLKSIVVPSNLNDKQLLVNQMEKHNFTKKASVNGFDIYTKNYTE